MVLTESKKHEEEGLKLILQREGRCCGQENTLKRLQRMRDYALKSLAEKNHKDCADALDDIMPYFLGMIGDYEREL